MNINPLVVDLSHWDPASDYAEVKRSGVVGVIFKSTEGTSYRDPTYVAQRDAAKAAGLLWGSYHFADGSNIDKQVRNYLEYTDPRSDELICLDWEDNPSGSKMALSGVKRWIDTVEDLLQRPNQCVLYSGNTAKEALGNTVDEFLAKHRLWVCQYASEPEWQASWEHYWLWQFTDGEYGPQPHTVPGIGPCDINHYDNTAYRLITEWATGANDVAGRPPPDIIQNPAVVTVTIAAPPGVKVKVVYA